MNGHGVDLSQAKIIQPKKFTFDEGFIRKIIAEAKENLERAGQCPIVDPVGMIVLGVVMDKIEALNKRLSQIERDVAPPPHTGFGGDR